MAHKFALRSQLEPLFGNLCLQTLRRQILTLSKKCQQPFATLFDNFYAAPSRRLLLSDTPERALHGVTNPKRTPRELQNWRVQGKLPTLCQPSPTLCQPFANPSPTFCQPFTNLVCQPHSKLLFPWTPGEGLETRVNGFLGTASRGVL